MCEIQGGRQVSAFYKRPRRTVGFERGKPWRTRRIRNEKAYLFGVSRRHILPHDPRGKITNVNYFWNTVPQRSRALMLRDESGTDLLQGTKAHEYPGFVKASCFSFSFTRGKETRFRSSVFSSERKHFPVMNCFITNSRFPASRRLRVSFAFFAAAKRPKGRISIRSREFYIHDGFIGIPKRKEEA